MLVLRQVRLVAGQRQGAQLDEAPLLVVVQHLADVLVHVQTVEEDLGRAQQVEHLDPLDQEDTDVVVGKVEALDADGELAPHLGPLVQDGQVVCDGQRPTAIVLDRPHGLGGSVLPRPGRGLLRAGRGELAGGGRRRGRGREGGRQGHGGHLLLGALEGSVSLASRLHFARDPNQTDAVGHEAGVLARHGTGDDPGLEDAVLVVAPLRVPGVHEGGPRDQRYQVLPVLVAGGPTKGALGQLGRPEEAVRGRRLDAIDHGEHPDRGQAGPPPVVVVGVVEVVVGLRLARPAIRRPRVQFGGEPLPVDVVELQIEQARVVVLALAPEHRLRLISMLQPVVMALSGPRRPLLFA